MIYALLSVSAFAAWFVWARNPPQARTAVTGSQDRPRPPLWRRVSAAWAPDPATAIDRLGVTPWPELDLAAQVDAGIHDLMNDTGQDRELDHPGLTCAEAQELIDHYRSRDRFTRGIDS